MDVDFTQLNLPINQVFRAIQGQPWVKRPRLLKHDPTCPRVEEYCSYHDSWGFNTIQCCALKKHLEDLIRQGYLKEFILTPEASFEAAQQKGCSV